MFYFADEPIGILRSRTVCPRRSVTGHITRGDCHSEVDGRDVSVRQVCQLEEALRLHSPMMSSPNTVEIGGAWLIWQ